MFIHQRAAVYYTGTRGVVAYMYTFSNEQIKKKKNEMKQTKYRLGAYSYIYKK